MGLKLTLEAKFSSFWVALGSKTFQKVWVEEEAPTLVRHHAKVTGFLIGGGAPGRCGFQMAFWVRVLI